MVAAIVMITMNGKWINDEIQKREMRKERKRDETSHADNTTTTTTTTTTKQNGKETMSE